jgi:D-sedoheptulose 7-phosphate isomerase
MEQRVIEFFNGSIEATMSAGEGLVLPLVESASVIVEALLGEGRLFTCGNGLSSTLASTFSYCLLNPYRIERPGFPAMCLSVDGVTGTGITQQANFSELYSRQLRALARSGDILALFSNGSNSGNLVQAVRTAHDRDLTVIAFTGARDADISALLTGEDVELRVENEDPYRIQETQLLSVFCLCELIEQQLFGG